jgi:hypothetical protein
VGTKRPAMAMTLQEHWICLIWNIQWNMHWICLIWNALGPEVFQVSDWFSNMEYLQKYNELSWGWGPNLNSKFIHFIHAFYISPKDIIYNIFSTLTFWLYLTRSQIWNFPLMTSYQHPKNFRFWSISDFIFLDWGYSTCNHKAVSFHPAFLIPI